MKDRDVAALRGGIGERPDLVAKLVVDREREDLRLVAHRAEQIAHAAGAVANRVARVGGRHPLVHAHQRFSSTSPAFDSGLSGRPRKIAGPVLLQLEQLFGEPDLIPEIPRDRRRRLARALQHLVDVTQQRAVEIFRS